MVQIGDEVRDTVTGVVGKVIGITKWITGCDQAIVQPCIVSKDGKLSESYSFDVTRLAVVKANAVKLPKAVANPGGPHPGY